MKNEQINKQIGEFRESENDEEPPTKETILKSISEGIRQAKLHQKGKLKLKSAQQLLDEL